MRVSAGVVLKAGLACSLGVAICGCSRGAAAGGSTQSSSGAEAQQSNIQIDGNQPGVTPFIASVGLVGQNVPDVVAVTFNIAPKPNTVSKPVNVTWTRAALASGGYLQPGAINLPVFGLYDGYQNQVTLQVQFADGSVQQLEDPIATAPYSDPTGVYKNPTIFKARTAGSSLGFNFFIMKSQIGSPVIVDTDGEVRWVVPAPATMAAYFANGQFWLGSVNSPQIDTLQFDGTEALQTTALPQPLLATFTHNIDPGTKLGSFLAEFNGTDDLGKSTGDIVAEILPESSQPVMQTFDLADILTAYMQKNGDDPTAFVRPGVDWFHVNASVYDPYDDSVIVSSRENFLIKLDYQTKDIIWILGDPTKYWYTFPSLRAKALTLDPGGDYPIGQHGVSITSDGYVMVFNDGLGSLNEPAGEPAGLSRSYSEVSVYSVNSTAMTAHQVWNFNYGQSILSPICGSSYEAAGTYLVDFATADNYKHARLVGLDPNHNVVFDFQYNSPSVCAAGWNAIPINLEDMEIN
ncbi:MAG TPA: aryl-sulfate sulfotransferase [Terracidiphilus sp.]|nr:aryl-sulfate sulfotransferase [Terracidiphilus sp.]